jgi:hypothetical protein
MQFDSVQSLSAKHKIVLKMRTLKIVWFKYISSNFQVLTQTITKFEKTGSPLTESASMVDNVLNTFKIAPGKIARKAFFKLQSVWQKIHTFQFYKS